MSENRQTTVRYLIQQVIIVALFAASLFISAGDIGWLIGWIFIAIFAFSQILITIVLSRKNPELMGERAESKGERDLDRVLAGIMALFGPISICIVAGLDFRFDWKFEILYSVQITGIVITVSGALLSAWAMGANKYFYGVFRIAEDKEHQVCDSGPYQYVRHPGYLGAILFDIGAPFMLNSAWALIPAILTVFAIIIRTGYEDKSLHKKLNGYKEYMQEVEYRLFPWVW